MPLPLNDEDYTQILKQGTPEDLEALGLSDEELDYLHAKAKGSQHGQGLAKSRWEQAYTAKQNLQQATAQNTFPTSNGSTPLSTSSLGVNLGRPINRGGLTFDQDEIPTPIPDLPTLQPVGLDEGMAGGQRFRRNAAIGTVNFIPGTVNFFTNILKNPMKTTEGLATQAKALGKVALWNEVNKVSPRAGAWLISKGISPVEFYEMFISDPIAMSATILGVGVGVGKKLGNVPVETPIGKPSTVPPIESVLPIERRIGIERPQITQMATDIIKDRPLPEALDEIYRRKAVGEINPAQKSALIREVQKQASEKVLGPPEEPSLPTPETSDTSTLDKALSDQRQTRPPLPRAGESGFASSYIVPEKEPYSIPAFTIEEAGKHRLAADYKKYSLDNPRVEQDARGIGTNYPYTGPLGETVTLYRAVSPTTKAIEPGQYVTLSKEYADAHLVNNREGASRIENPQLMGGGKVLSITVPKEDVTVLANNELAWTPLPRAGESSGPVPIEVPKTNVVVPLTKHAKTLYRETNLDEALKFIREDNSFEGFETRELHMATTPDLALGQGSNRGVLLEFDPAKLQGKLTQKPGWELRYPQGINEVIGKYNSQDLYQAAIKSITILPDAVASKVAGARFHGTLKRMRQNGWAVEKSEDGIIRLTNPSRGPTVSMLGTGHIGDMLTAPKPPAITRESVLTNIGQSVAIATQKTSGLARQRPNLPLNNSADWAVKVVEEAKRQGIEPPTPDELRGLWHAIPTRIGRTGSGNVNLDIAAAPRGMTKAFMREMGDPQLGVAAYNLKRLGDARENLMRRLVRETTKTQFKPLKKGAETDLFMAMVAQPEPGRYGSWVRVGLMDSKKAAQYIETTGSHQLPDGTFLGPTNEAQTRIYWMTKPENAKGIIEQFHKDHPEAVPLLEELTTFAHEAAQFNQLGDIMPFKSFKNLKAQYNVSGLGEADILNELAMGEGVIPESLQMAYTPDLAGVAKPRSTYGRLKNYLNTITASTRRVKTGATAAKILGGEAEAQIQKGSVLAREGLALEDIHNTNSLAFLTLGLEPIGPEGVRPGYMKFSKRLFGENAERWDKFVTKNEDTFNDLGVNWDEPTAEGATAYQVSRGLVEHLRPAFVDDFISTDPKYQARMEAVRTALDTAISTINTVKLTGFSTQITQSWVGNSVLASTRVVRDALKPIIEAAMPSSTEGRFANMQDSLSQLMADVRATGTAFTPSTRQRIPAELLGETSAYDIAGGYAPARKIMSLALTPMRWADIAAKRWNMEASFDGAARIAWNQAKRNKAIPGGMTKEQFIRQYKANVPKEIMALGAIEMDTYGAFDYTNLGKPMRLVKGSGQYGDLGRWGGIIGKSVLPFPSWPYKIINNYYGNLATALVDMANPRNRAKQVNAIATVAAYTLLHAAAYQWYKSKRPKDLKEEVPAFPVMSADELEGGQGLAVGEKDLPYHLRKSMRIPIGSDTWTNVAQVPILGPAALAYEIENSGSDATDFFNNQLGLGILPQVYMMSAGISNQYNQNLTTGNKVGQFIAQSLPGQGELFMIRKLHDPFRRELHEPGDKWDDDLVKAFRDRYPILSTILEPRVKAKTREFMKYNPREVSLSYLLGSTTIPKDEDRKAAATAAYIALLDRSNQEIDEEELATKLLPLMSTEGTTPSTELVKTIHAQAAQYEAARITMLLRMKRAYYRSHGDNTVLASEMGAYLKGVKDPRILGKLTKAGLSAMWQLIKSGKLDQFTLDFMAAPAEIQGQFAPQLQQAPQSAQ